MVSELPHVIGAEPAVRAELVGLLARCAHFVPLIACASSTRAAARIAGTERERSAELTALVFNAFSPDRTAKCPHYSDRNPATVVAVKSL
jgi:hypothetical protein